MFDDIEWKSPIKIIQGQMRVEIDDNIVRACQDIGVDVNKERLFEIIRDSKSEYDKGYLKGYQNGVADTIRRIMEILRDPNAIDEFIKNRECEDYEENIGYRGED